MSADDRFPVIDRQICNQCQKCVAICPQQALLVDGVRPLRMTDERPVSPEALEALMARRRSIKRFADRPIPRALLERIAQSGRYAPNQYKNIDAIIVDDPLLLSEIDRGALGSVRRWYRILFGFRPLTWFCSLFSEDLFVIKKKMERDLFTRGRIMKPGTKALILLTGDPRVSMTRASAQYLLANMILYAQTHGVSSCLMDSLRLTLTSSKMKRRLTIASRDTVLGVLSLGYSAERIVNIPEGYRLNIRWNAGR